MNKNIKFIMKTACILSGACALVASTFTYALLSIYSLGNIKIILITISLGFLVAYAALLWISSRRYNIRILKVKKIFLNIIVTAIIGWLMAAGSIYFSIYHVLFTDSPVSNKTFYQVKQPDTFENISIELADGITVQGVLYKENPGRSPLAIYFGGRGEEASNIVEYAGKIKGSSLAFINYRGCGLSEGKQNEKNLLSDAAAVYDYFAGRKDIDGNKIALIAHSLGTGIAIQLASHRDVKGVVLSAPYDKYTAGVIQDKFPLVPVGLLSHDEFDSEATAPKLKVPALFLLAEDDRTVLRGRSLKLFSKWGGQAEKVIIKGTHHENITLNAATWQNINMFLEKINKTR